MWLLSSNPGNVSCEGGSSSSSSSSSSSFSPLPRLFDDDCCTVYLLKEGSTLNLGRGGGNDIQLPNSSSVSRHHASLTATSRGDLRVLHIQDKDSRYGTYVGLEAIRSSAMGSQEDRSRGLTEISKGEPIRFGLHSDLFYAAPLRFVVMGSSLKKGEKEDLMRTLGALRSNGVPIQFTDSWKEDVTHLVMKSVILTMKVAQALARNLPIVTPDYFQHLQISTRDPISNPVQFPTSSNFIPPLNENSLNPNLVSLKRNPKRTQLFKDKIFVFHSRESAEKYEKVIESASGSTLVPRQEIELTNSMILMRPPEAGSSSSSSQVMPTSKSNRFFDDLMSRYWPQKNTIPETQIALALVYVSTEIYCNPNYRASQILRSSQRLSQNPQNSTLVPETQDSSKLLSSTRGTLTRKVVDETMKSTATSSLKSQKSHSMDNDDDNDDLFKIPSLTPSLRTQNKDNGSESTIMNRDDSRKPNNDVNEGSMSDEDESYKSSSSVKGSQSNSLSKQRNNKRPLLNSEDDSDSLFEGGIGKTSTQIKNKKCKLSSTQRKSQTTLENLTKEITKEESDEDEDLFAFNEDGIAGLNTQSKSKNDKNRISMKRAKSPSPVKSIKKSKYNNESASSSSSLDREDKNSEFKYPRLVHANFILPTVISKERQTDSLVDLSKFIGKGDTSKVETIIKPENSVSDMHELTRSYGNVQLADLIRNDKNITPQSSYSSDNVPNFKRFKRGKLMPPPKRIQGFVRNQDLAREKRIDEFFHESIQIIEDEERQQKEAEEFWDKNVY